MVAVATACVASRAPTKIGNNALYFTRASGALDPSRILKKVPSWRSFALEAQDVSHDVIGFLGLQDEIRHVFVARPKKDLQRDGGR